MIALWGVLDDTPTVAVRDALVGLGADTFLIDQRRFAESSVHLIVGGETARVDGVIRLGNESIQLGHVSAAYLRPESLGVVAHLHNQPVDPPSLAQAGRMNELLSTWAETTDALVVNRPSAGSSNASKPYQAAMLRRRGFATPRTLITTNRQELCDFAKTCGSVVYKSISSRRSIVTRLDPRDEDKLGRLQWCPTQFQEEISGDDYRTHVVGEKIFTCRIDSDAVDYRYPYRDGAEVTFTPARLPGPLEDRCRTLTKALGLVVSGIDLRYTPDGVWYCFEANPSPAFTFYESRTGQPIAQAVAELLTKRSSGPLLGQG